MHITRRHIIALLLLTVAFTFALAWVWEHGLESAVAIAMGIPYEPEFEVEERSRFILTSTAFAAVALVFPGILLTYLVGRLSSAYLLLIVSEEETRHISWHDPLTGLANRRLLQIRMEEGVSSESGFKLLLIDLDRFKSVNDSFGHAVGDRLLIQVADRIRVIAGPESCAARLGGDEFAVLVAGDMLRSHEVADGIIAALKGPFEIGRFVVSIGCSIGMCCTEDAEAPDQLLKQADLALYTAKRQGGGVSCCYQPGMLEEATERNRLDTDLRVALDDEQFHLVYQPVLDLRSNGIIGYEALIRWNHPVLGLVPPMTFIPIAESTGQIVGIGRWVLDEACRQAASWPNGLTVAINVSPLQFRSPLFCSHVSTALAKSGLAAHRLEIELTETALVEDGPEIALALGELRSLGISVALDDFGTGYSSLSHLRDFPLDRIKIDRSFVATAEIDRHSMAVLRAVAQVGRDLDISVLAEGVETQSQLQLVRDIGCDAAQGYLIGKPGPISSRAGRSTEDMAVAATEPAASRPSRRRV